VFAGVESQQSLCFRKRAVSTDALSKAEAFFMNELRERVLELLNYDQATGLFTRRDRRGRFQAGSVVGSLDRDGYRVMKIDGKSHQAHRLAFLVIHGYLPKEIDHINGDPSDNRIENLRSVTRSENQRNSGKYANNTSGFKGVCWHSRDKKWQAQARDANGKRKTLGYFPTPEAASAAYNDFAMKLHGEFYRPTVNQ